jgi:hypothetical protein
VEAPVRFTDGVRPLTMRLELRVLVPLKMRAPMSLVFMLRRRRVPPEMFAVVVKAEDIGDAGDGGGGIDVGDRGRGGAAKVLVRELTPVEVMKPSTGS